MTNYIVKGQEIHFRQSFTRAILCKLFVILYSLDVEIMDTGTRSFPHRVVMSESDFNSILELCKGE